MEIENRAFEKTYNNSPPVRPSLLNTIKEVKAKIEYDCFNTYVATGAGRRFTVENKQAKELCTIIAQTLLMNPDTEIKVNGEFLPAFLVQEIFNELTHAHIELVLENFNKITYIVTNKSVFLRTALYNSVSELNSHYKNQVNHDLHG